MNGGKNFSALKISRIVIQVLFFIFLPAWYFQTFAGVKQLYLSLIHHQFSAALWPQIIGVLVIIPVTLFAGRFFCGWMCAFGSLTDWIYRGFQKLFHKNLKIGETWDHRLKFLKYAILLLIIVTSWTFQSSLFSSSNPWDVFGAIAAVGNTPNFADIFANMAAGFALFCLITAVSAFSERFFCRYLCPMGALFSLVSRFKTIKFKKPSTHCGSCKACTNSCAMGIPLYRMDSVGSGECINCMKCVSACPRGNISLTVSGRKIRPLAAGIAAAVIVTGLYLPVQTALTQIAQKSAAPSGQAGTAEFLLPDSSAQSFGPYKDGTYQGSGTGFHGGRTTVTVVVSGGNITTIQVDSCEDTPSFFNTAYTVVSDEIIRSQSTDVDAVSGATYSSMGIMEAVADALSSART